MCFLSEGGEQKTLVGEVREKVFASWKVRQLRRDKLWKTKDKERKPFVAAKFRSLSGRF